jgi:hypothetical protein
MNPKKKNMLISDMSGLAGPHAANHVVKQEEKKCAPFRRSTDGHCLFNIKYRNVQGDVSLTEGDPPDVSNFAEASA